jgi:apolipoprotein N-acyltransferase
LPLCYRLHLSKSHYPPGSEAGYSVSMSKIQPPLADIRPTKRQPKPFLYFAIAFSSGILMGLAAAPLNIYPLAWVALVPLWVLVFGGEGQKAKGKRQEAENVSSPIALAFAWGFGYHGLALSWIMGLHPLTWMGIPWLGSVAIALFCWAFITFWGAALVAVWVWGMGRLGTLPLTRILFGTALWCGLERLWSLGALNWTSLSYTQSPGNLLILHLGQLSGPLTVTAAIVAVNGLLAEALMSGQIAGDRWQAIGRQRAEELPNSKSLLLLAVILVITFHLIGFGLFSRPLGEADGSALRVGIIQGNVPTRIKLFSEGVRRAEQGYTQGYEKLADQGVEAVLTPEGALPYLWNRPNSLASPFYQAVLKKQVIAWLGTFTAQKGGIARTLVTLTGDGQIFSFYNKIKLVPLGEYTPFQKVLGGIVGRLSPVSEDGVPGTFNQIMDTPFGRSIASICYDSAFPEVFRLQAAAGGQFILTASNLDPYSEVLMAQHQAQDLMRAIETDRWAVRATNTGYSGIINPHGTIVWRSQPKTYEIHADTIYRRLTQTPYVFWGDWLTPLLLASAGIVWLFQQMRTRNLNQ